MIQTVFHSINNAHRLLKQGTQVHITTRTAKDGRNWWNVQFIGASCGWTCLRQVRFDPAVYRGYQNKHGNNKGGVHHPHVPNDAFPLDTRDRPAVTYIFEDIVQRPSSYYHYSGE